MPGCRSLAGGRRPWRVGWRWRGAPQAWRTLSPARELIEPGLLPRRHVHRDSAWRRRWGRRRDVGGRGRAGVGREPRGGVRAEAHGPVDRRPTATKDEGPPDPEQGDDAEARGEDPA